MKIIFKTTKSFIAEQLQKLFKSVNWSSGDYPERLAKAIKGYSKVYSAWQDEQLVGLAAAMDDGEMTAYIHYLLVMPEYQRCGIGGELMRMMKDCYKDYLKIVLIAYGNGIQFYRSLGFSVPENSFPMYLTEMY